MRGTLYTSWKDSFTVSHVDEAVAVFENGKIYLAADGFLGTTAKGALIGEYENGIVYTVGTGTFNSGKRLNAVAVIEHGEIYSISNGILGGISKSLSVGECSGGKVYSHSHGILEASESFALYDGDEEGAAAAAAIVLFKLESNVSAAYRNDERKKASTRTRSSNNSSDEMSAIEDFFWFWGLIFKAIGFIFKLAFMVVVWIIKLVKKSIDKHKEKQSFEEKNTLEEPSNPPVTEVHSSTYETEDIALKTFPATEATIEKNSNKKVAFILACIPYTGWFGVHDFYLGKLGSGFLKLFTFNYIFVGWILDIINIKNGRYKAKNGDLLE